MYQQRITTVQKLLLVNNLSATLISSPSHIHYLTGYSNFSPIEREAFLLVTQQSGYLFTDSRYIEETTKHIPHVQSVEKTRHISLSEFVKQIAEKETLTTIGFEDTDLSVAEYVTLKKTKIHLLPFPLHSLRDKKDDIEIAAIKKAAKIATHALQTIKKQIIPGYSERQIVQLLEQEIRMNDAEIAFPTIVAFGKNAAVPHHFPNNTKLKKNDSVLIDFGAKWNGYCSDITRTFFMWNPTPLQKELYTAVAQAQEKAKNYIQSLLDKKMYKIPASDVDKVARTHLLSLDHPPIPHAVGHGIGIDVHESPTISPHSKDFLTEGMVFSLEPGIYLAGKIGIRIEDLFVIKNNRIQQLT